jgi:hypothetical protein
MRNQLELAAPAFGVVSLALACGAWAFDSGSNGAGGDLVVSVSQQIALPADGVLQYRSLRVTSSGRLTFTRNAMNTPAVILVQGDVNIEGVIDVSGGAAPASGTAGSGNVGDDGLPGLGGPGGYDGGLAAALSSSTSERGSDGLGPGGGKAGQFLQNAYSGGGGGGFGANGANDARNRVPGGTAYGSAELFPLIGGSGGGGGTSTAQWRGSGGGGGGGAILIAASGTVTLAQGSQILANGGASGELNGSLPIGSTGGGGSGGAIRIVATTITGTGTLQAKGGDPGTNSASSSNRGGAGGTGRIRLEAENFGRTTTTDPVFSFGKPAPVNLAQAPSLRIRRIAGFDVPAQPTGRGDVLLPADFANPATVEIEAAGVPPGTVVRLTLTPSNAASTTVDSTALAGDAALASASASLVLPQGPSMLIATVTYDITLAMGEALSRFAQNERVERIRVESALGGASSATLITTSGREYPLPAAALAALGG